MKIHNLDIHLHDCYNIPNLHFYFYIFHFFFFFARQTQLSPTINFLLIQRLNSEQYFIVNFSRQIHSYVICAYIYIRAFNRIEISIEKHPRFLIFSITTNIWQAVEKSLVARLISPENNGKLSQRTGGKNLCLDYNVPREIDAYDRFSFFFFFFEP